MEAEAEGLPEPDRGAGSVMALTSLSRPGVGGMGIERRREEAIEGWEASNISEFRWPTNGLSRRAEPPDMRLEVGVSAGDEISESGGGYAVRVR